MDAAPLILLASNRASVRDRMALEHAPAQSDVEEKQNERLLGGNTEILKRVEALEQQILELERKILERLPSKNGVTQAPFSLAAPRTDSRRLRGQACIRGASSLK